MQHIHNPLQKNAYKTNNILQRRKGKMNEKVDQQEPKTYAYLLDIAWSARLKNTLEKKNIILRFNQKDRTVTPTK